MSRGGSLIAEGTKQNVTYGILPESAVNIKIDSMTTDCATNNLLVIGGTAV